MADFVIFSSIFALRSSVEEGRKNTYKRTSGARPEPGRDPVEAGGLAGFFERFFQTLVGSFPVRADAPAGAANCSS